MKSDELDELAATCRTLFHDKTESDLFAVPVSELQIMEYLTPIIMPYMILMIT